MNHNKNQKIIDELYNPYKETIKKTLCYRDNELYGEVYYYSVLKLLKQIDYHQDDTFVDIGSGIGKLCFYMYILTDIKNIYGVEINQLRSEIACKAKQSFLKFQQPNNRILDFRCDNFLELTIKEVNIAYVCSTIFSFELLENLGKKLNSINSLRQIISFRRLPYLENFKLKKKLFLHCSWDLVGCYIYERVR